MVMRFGVGDAFIEQPGVHLVIGLEPQPWCKEALTHEPDLVLDLTLLPTRGRGAGDRLHQIMAAHLQETPIVEAVLADEDRLHRGLHVVVDAASTRPLEQREGAVVSIEHHLLRLARITPDTRHYELPSSMGGESSEAWRAVLEDLIKRGLQRPQFLIVDGAAGLEKAIAAVWEGAPVQRCTVHKHRNLLAHAPERLHDEISADYTDMIYAETAQEIEQRRKAFIRKWRLRHRPVADCLEEAGDRLFTFTRLPPSQWRSARTTNAIERLHEEFKRRIKTQTVLPSAETAAMLFWALLASGQINMRKVDGWQTLATKPFDQPIDLAA